MGYRSLAVVLPCGGTTTLVEQHPTNIIEQQIESDVGCRCVPGIGWVDRNSSAYVEGRTDQSTSGFGAYVDGRTRRWRAMTCCVIT